MDWKYNQNSNLWKHFYNFALFPSVQRVKRFLNLNTDVPEVLEKKAGFEVTIQL